MENVGGIRRLNMRDLCICVLVCCVGLVVKHLWQCQCVTAAPLAGEQRLERLPSRVAFVW